MHSVIRDVSNTVMGSKALSDPMKLGIYKSKEEQDLVQDMLPERPFDLQYRKGFLPALRISVL